MDKQDKLDMKRNLDFYKDLDEINSRIIKLQESKIKAIRGLYKSMVSFRFLQGMIIGLLISVGLLILSNL